MRDILEKIFLQNNFIKDPHEISDYYINKGKSENYLVYYLNSFTKEDIDKILGENFIELQKYDKEKKSNTSIIFVTKIEDKYLNEEEKKLVFEIEEDPFYYKKYLLWYTEEELVNISNYSEDITNKIVNKDIFKDMKNAMEGNINYTNEIHSYELLCRIFIKLPFLSLENIYHEDEENEMDKLLSNIDAIMIDNAELIEELENKDIYLAIDMSDEDKNKYLEIIEDELRN